MNLTNYEKETIITFNEAEKTAEIFTYNSKMLRSLSTLAADRPDDAQRIKTNADGGETYRIPKSWVKVKAPRIMSESELVKRQALARQLSKSKINH